MHGSGNGRGICILQFSLLLFFFSSHGCLFHWEYPLEHPLLMTDELVGFGGFFQVSVFVKICSVCFTRLNKWLRPLLTLSGDCGRNRLTKLFFFLLFNKLDKKKKKTWNFIGSDTRPSAHILANFLFFVTLKLFPRTRADGNNHLAAQTREIEWVHTHTHTHNIYV